MVSKAIKEVRCSDVLDAFMSGSKGCVFLTMTTPDVVDIYEIRCRWRRVRHFLVERFPGVKYVMNFEIHPKGHGWHVHSVWNRYIPLIAVLDKFHQDGFGRVDIRRVNSKGVSDYLTKHALKAYRGVSNAEIKRNPSFRLRLVNASRGLPVLSDYHYESDFKRDVKALYDKAKASGRKIKNFRSFYSYLEVASQLKLSSVVELQKYLLAVRRDWKMNRVLLRGQLPLPLDCD